MAEPRRPPAVHLWIPAGARGLVTTLGLVRFFAGMSQSHGTLVVGFSVGLAEPCVGDVFGTWLVGGWWLVVGGWWLVVGILCDADFGMH